MTTCFLIDTEGRKYLCLDNHENINCYFVTALQILHSSDTFITLIKKHRDELINKFPQLFSPLLAYEANIYKIDDSSASSLQVINDILQQIDNEITINPPAIRDGYDWLKMLNFYYFPIAWSLLEDDEKKINSMCEIFHEMSIEWEMIPTQGTSKFNFLFKSSDISALSYAYYENIDTIIETYKNKDYKHLYNCTALESYIDEQYGHVFPVINCGGSLYVSDNHHLTTLYKYVFSGYLRADKLRLNYYSDEILNLYNNDLHLSGEQFVHNQYSIVLRNADKVLLPRKYKNELDADIISYILNKRPPMTEHKGDITIQTIQTDANDINIDIVDDTGDMFDGSQDNGTQQQERPPKAIIIREECNIIFKYLAFIFMVLFLVSVVIILIIYNKYRPFNENLINDTN